MQAVTIFARGPLAGALGIDAGGAVVKVAGKITIAGALKRRNRHGMSGDAGLLSDCLQQ